MTQDLFDHFESSMSKQDYLAPGAFILRRFALTFENILLEELEKIFLNAPCRHMQTPGGYTMSASMTNCGKYGWVSETSGYRYSNNDPLSARPWPVMPAAFSSLALEAAASAGFHNFSPDACLINRYTPGAKLGLHQDKDEKDLTQPIVSISLGIPAIFLFGGFKRNDKTLRLHLGHGDVVVWGGPSRLRYHGVLTIRENSHTLLGRQRINLSFRKIA